MVLTDDMNELVWHIWHNVRRWWFYRDWCTYAVDRYFIPFFLISTIEKRSLYAFIEISILFCIFIHSNPNDACLILWNRMGLEHVWRVLLFIFSFTYHVHRLVFIYLLLVILIYGMEKLREVRWFEVNLFFLFLMMFDMCCDVVWFGRAILIYFSSFSQDPEFDYN